MQLRITLNNYFLHQSSLGLSRWPSGSRTRPHMPPDVANKNFLSTTNFCQQLFSIPISELRKKKGRGGGERKRMRVEERERE